MKRQICVFDTETSGLPAEGNSLAQQPYIVSISWQILEYDTVHDKFSTEVIDNRTAYIAVPIELDEKVQQIHGITNEWLKENGRPCADVFKEFYESVKNCELFVAHNAAFDMQMLYFDSLRINDMQMLQKILFTATYCTSADSRNWSINTKIQPGVNIKGRLNLRKLHEILFGFAFDNAHTADADVDALVKSLVELHKRGIVKKQQLSMQCNIAYVCIRQNESGTYKLHAVKSVATHQYPQLVLDENSVSDFDTIAAIISNFAYDCNIIVFEDEAITKEFIRKTKHAKTQTTFGFAFAYPFFNKTIVKPKLYTDAANAYTLHALHSGLNYSFKTGFYNIVDSGNLY